jgi:hypothetical protein
VIFLTEHHTMKACWGSGLGTRWRWVVSFMLRPLYPPRKESPWCPLDKSINSIEKRFAKLRIRLRLLDGDLQLEAFSQKWEHKLSSSNMNTSKNFGSDFTAVLVYFVSLNGHFLSHLTTDLNCTTYTASNDKMALNGELWKMWKEPVVAYFKLSLQHLQKGLRRYSTKLPVLSWLRMFYKVQWPPIIWSK